MASPSLSSRNLYQECSGSPVRASPLQEDVVADAVIVGGGFTGLSVALHLAQSGLKPVVLEAEDIGHGCSGRNGGQVNPGLKLFPDEIEAAFGKDLGGRMVRRSYNAPSEVFDLIAEHAINCSATRSGTIRAAIDTVGLKSVQTLVSQCQRRNDPIVFADASEMRALTGTGIYLGGAFDKRGGHLNPLAYARGLASAAQRYGATLHSHSKAEDIRRVGNEWRVKTSAGSVSAAQLVICTNGYTGDLWPGMRQTIVPVYTYVVASEPLPAAIRQSIMPSQAALFEATWDVIYYRIDDAGRLIVGGRGPQREALGPADFHHLIAYACKLWPQLKGIAWPWHWYGQVAITKDHLPQLVEPEEGVRLMYGYNGRGIAMATVAGRLVAERIISGGKAEVDLPVRETLLPVPFQSFWKIGANTSIAWNLLRDRLRGR